MVKIDFLDFIKYGKFDFVELGQTKEWIVANFLEPDGFCADFLKPKCNIWTYGNIEFHFNKKNELFLIFSDYIDELSGGKNLDLNKWLFEDYSKLCLAYVLQQLNQQNIDYCKVSDQFGVRLIITNSHVELAFSKDFDEIIADPNQLCMTSFSFIDRAKSIV